jgi:UDP-N-acetylglucosamine:LPS N-acetylglucosamine transferase
MVVLADNQRRGAQALHEAQAAFLVGEVRDIARQLPSAITALTAPHRLREMSTKAAALTQGRGVDNVLGAMEVLND